jgi:predicted O-linked N-acetylglucosamine transferase (SPINDLY family)
MAMQRLPEALACHDEALRLDPRHFEARINRSSVLQRLGRIQEAIADVGLALDARPDSALALTNAGNLRLALDQNAEALISFERALAVAPRDVDACYGRGAALLALGRSEEAVEAFLAVLRARPDHPHALGHLFKWRMQRCEWTDYGSTSTALHKALSQNPRFVNPLITLLFDDPELSLRCATNFVAEYHPRDPCLGPPSPRHSGSRLRIAYVSADFSEHPVSELLIGPLERHDRSRFEILGVSLRLRGGGTFEKRVRGAFDAVVDVAGWSDQDIARWMRESGVDIAIDLMGPTVGQRLGIFACRGAPLQVAFLGHAGTVGAPYIDYLIADPTVIPAGNERWFVEAVARLPHCLLPNDDRREIGPRPERHEAGLPERGLVLCAFTQTHKINPPMFEIWMRLLGAAPDGVLWLRDPGAEAGANLRREAVARGIDARRLVFAPRLAGRAAHLGRQQLADLYLDTLPYNAHSTTCDALWSGVPVLTCMGNTMASRVAASALRAIGLPELISDSLEAYERAGVLLVTEPARLAALRARLAENRRSAPLFDTESYTRALEEAYIRMNAHASAGGEPRSFDVVGRAPG